MGDQLTRAFVCRLPCVPVDPVLWFPLPCFRSLPRTTQTGVGAVGGGSGVSVSGGLGVVNEFLKGYKKLHNEVDAWLILKVEQLCSQCFCVAPPLRTAVVSLGGQETCRYFVCLFFSTLFRFGPARVIPVRFDSVRFSSVRLGSIHRLC